jgi:hypothetical protein
VARDSVDELKVTMASQGGRLAALEAAALRGLPLQLRDVLGFGSGADSGTFAGAGSGSLADAGSGTDEGALGIGLFEGGKSNRRFVLLCECAPARHFDVSRGHLLSVCVLRKRWTIPRIDPRRGPGSLDSRGKRIRSYSGGGEPPGARGSARCHHDSSPNCPL